ncbi:PDZ/DHR/GLGF domain protein [Desulfofarcimen acetoxidans DSM 771]|uniref:PDZ/DHR/GLGF domain protein n=1 Tax=Desulfofarcimen acetoxidans (strain ATCC 49208 / DSM 771 / KCTC 5769 / VKM B-1644 / 5575) TaxID=485916 RepID=C8VY26_DESAS|nr:PDZ domain-containing protein [Desulfofarcimen acetoxidans]ACV64655.1 PDZ/DHR/GLGF domain protein [Desulfofarcimen acetoxidans DSM 771]
MSLLGQLLPLILHGISRAVMDDLFWVVVLLIAFQYRRTNKEKERIAGMETKTLSLKNIFNSSGFIRDTLAATGFGLLGGLLGSLLMVYIGLTLSGSGLLYLWPLAILLMLIDARFLCFAYAGGILALSSLLLGFPRINIPQLIALVAVLHMVESVLILASGHLGASPVYIKNRVGRIVGGFTLQKFWPIPLVGLLVVGQGAMVDGVDMPGWWPLIKSGLPGDPNSFIYTLLPVVAGLGYGDVAIARTPNQKSRMSAFFLGLYSLILLLLALVADRSRFLALLAALFAPLGHELVIFIGKQVELVSPPLYAAKGPGLMVLDVFPDTPAWRAGLRSGDSVVEINGRPVADRESLDFLLETSYIVSELAYLKAGERQLRRVTVYLKPGQTFGILPVPAGNEGEYVEIAAHSPLRRRLMNLWQKIRS